MTFRRYALLAACLLVPTPAFAQDYLVEIGFRVLEQRLGAATPNGTGVFLAHVEASVSADPPTYRVNPNVASGRAGFTVTYRSPGSTDYSYHANFVAGLWYGNGAMASGVTQVESWNAFDWVTGGFLGYEGGAVPVTVNVPKVSNHSYIGSGVGEELLRRSDYFVDRADHVMVVGSGDNAANAGVSEIFGSGYNSIAVGTTQGTHGHGLTTYGGAGRVKPDLVAPDGFVSGATPIVAAAATLLVQTAGADALAAKPQTIKAVLMAGATKEEFSGWARTSTRPLDLTFGAGELNIDKSHRILTAGRQAASNAATVATTGWDFNSVNATTTGRDYFFDVPAGQSLTKLSAVLVWNREFADGSLTASMANLDLTLRQASGFTLIGAALDSSLSTVDNVEHIWYTAGLEAGRYAFHVELAGDATASFFALAWRAEFVAVPEPVGLIVFGAFGIWFRNFKSK